MLAIYPAATNQGLTAGLCTAVADILSCTSYMAVFCFDMQVTEEMEALEETLTDSIGDSIRGKREAAEAKAGPATTQAKPSRRCCKPQSEASLALHMSSERLLQQGGGILAAA